jgi:ribosome-associated protein
MATTKKPTTVKKPKAPASNKKVEKVEKVEKVKRVKVKEIKTIGKLDPEEALVRLCAEGALDKKAEDVVVLDMRKISSFTDFFLIVSGTSEPQLKAIAGSIREKVRSVTGLRPIAEDGFPISQWVIIDYGSVIIHIFHKDKRDLYGLESLWGDAGRLEIEE